VIASELEAGAQKLANLPLVIDNQYAVVGVCHLGLSVGAGLRNSHDTRSHLYDFV
jgi:hypothetical protein